MEKDLANRKENKMNKCKNCTKFLTCNREQCKQITYLQAGQIERIEQKEEENEKN